MGGTGSKSLSFKLSLILIRCLSLPQDANKPIIISTPKEAEFLSGRSVKDDDGSPHEESPAEARLLSRFPDS